MMRLFFLLTIHLSLAVACKTLGAVQDFPRTGLSSKEGQVIGKIEPPNWWVGLKDQRLQLLIYYPNISDATPQISYKGVSIERVTRADSPNYLFIDLLLAPSTKSGTFTIDFGFENGTKLHHDYELKDRKRNPGKFIGFNNRDAIYLITPDRFANANVGNDTKSAMREKTIDRSKGSSRHGGDIQGIIDHLDYIYGMGFTALWINPLLTNDMPEYSYHGYAITDFYEIDPRFGSLDDYLRLTAKAHKRGLKVIMDQVVNHCGLEHWWMKDLPFKDWVNQQDAFESKKRIQQTNHRHSLNQDRYASHVDASAFTSGWFVDSMPDLNQKNSFLARYLIQNSIWWIETAQLGGIRQDTYGYPDKWFMSKWAGAIMNEYPNFSIVGEEWVTNPLILSYWQDKSQNLDGYRSNLKSVFDFPMAQWIKSGLNDGESWGSGLIKMYEGLANDFAYPSPQNLVAFLDNHDMSRVFTQFAGDLTKLKMALSYLLILPRIPQIYYGTEILMDDNSNPGDHGVIRSDFPGGWQGDHVNAFTKKGLSSDQVQTQSFLRKLLQYRKSSDAIHGGRTVHFIPENGTYVIARISELETVVLILNKNSQPITLDLNRFEELDLEDKQLKNIVTGEKLRWRKRLHLKERGSLLLTTKRN